MISSQFCRNYNNRLYRAWRNMRKRCDNPCIHDEKYYGGKGITYTPEWDEFNNFVQWAIANGYSDNLTLDRIDGSKGYFPENCRWVTQAEQQRNKSNNRLFTHKGKTQTLSEWAREVGINRSTILDRIEKFGFSFEEAISRPTKMPRNTKLIEYSGQTFTLKQLEKKYGTPTYVLRRRIFEKGWSVDDAIFRPFKSRGKGQT